MTRRRFRVLAGGGPPLEVQDLQRHGVVERCDDRGRAVLGRIVVGPSWQAPPPGSPPKLQGTLPRGERVCGRSYLQTPGKRSGVTTPKGAS